MSQLVHKNLIFWLLLAFVLVMNVGGVLSSEMMMGEDGMMHNCPFMGMTALCEMSPLVHLSEWQQMFGATVQEISTILVLLLLAMGISWHFFDDLFRPKRTQRFVPRYRYTEKVFDPFRLAFARGIIHPKAF